MFTFSDFNWYSKVPNKRGGDGKIFQKLINGGVLINGGGGGGDFSKT